jgi:hypothetical protein
METQTLKAQNPTQNRITPLATATSACSGDESLSADIIAVYKVIYAKRCKPQFVEEEDDDFYEV